MAIYPLITLSCEELAGFADGPPKYEVVPLLFASNDHNQDVKMKEDCFIIKKEKSCFEIYLISSTSSC